MCACACVCVCIQPKYYSVATHLKYLDISIHDLWGKSLSFFVFLFF